MLSLEDVTAAQRRIANLLDPSPLREFPLLSASIGARVFVKLESVMPTGAFKVRGALNLMSGLAPSERGRGIVAATRGNHGQALAYAAARGGQPCTLFVPEGNNPDKNAAMRALGAQLRVAGEDFDAACVAAQAWADRTGDRLVHPGKEPLLFAGAGTAALELLAQAPVPLDLLVIPVGVGSLAAGMSVVFETLSPRTRIVGAQAANAPAMAHAWRTGLACESASAGTMADGLAVRRSVPETTQILRRTLDDMVLVQESEIARAIVDYLHLAHTLVEGAGAVALAALRRLVGDIDDTGDVRHAAVVASGSNLDHATLRHAMTVLQRTHREPSLRK